jgi:hypothetical protein
MKPFSEVLSGVTLQAADSAAVPTSVKVTPDRHRVSLYELENMYLNNPIIFNGINKMIQIIMASPHDLVGPKPSVVKFYQKFLMSIGNVGNQLEWEQLLARIFQDQAIYGWALVENIYNMQDGKLKDWDIIDCKRIDYVKDISNQNADADPQRDQGEIILDKFGKPVGYVQYLDYKNYTFKQAPQRKPIPREYQRYIGNNQVYFAPNQIALFKMYSTGDGFYPTGLVEPSYLISVQKLNIQNSVTQAVLRHGSPILLAKLGDSSHEPSPAQVQNILERLKNMSSSSELAIPYYYDVKFLESKDPASLQDQLVYYEDQEIAAMGMPAAFVKGSGSATNRSTLVTQDKLFRLSLTDLIQRTSETIRKHMFYPLAESNGIDKNDVPCLRWEIIGVEETSNKIDRVLNYVKEGILSPDQGLKVIQSIETLNIEDIDKMKKK